MKIGPNHWTKGLKNYYGRLYIKDWELKIEEWLLVIIVSLFNLKSLINPERVAKQDDARYQKEIGGTFNLKRT